MILEILAYILFGYIYLDDFISINHYKMRKLYHCYKSPRNISYKHNFLKSLLKL